MCYVSAKPARYVLVAILERSTKACVNLVPSVDAKVTHLPAFVIFLFFFAVFWTAAELVDAEAGRA